VAIGKKRRVYELQRDGSVVARKYMDACYVTDERIVDGFYFASVLRYIRSIIHDPSVLDLPPEEVVEDQD
jgi:pyruvate/2-oxoglutarate dehydrogenase complex dihydrolipoamide acyltransferase (E2) component